jgi:hypothetical protein
MRDARCMGEIISFPREKARRLLSMPTREYVPLERAAIKLLRDCPALDDPALIAATDDLGRALIGLIRICKLPGL